MGLLDDQLDADAVSFVDTDVFGEAITYTPLNGAAVSINAVVMRGVPEPLESNSETRQQGKSINLVVFIRNDATYGVTSVDTGGDKITVARRKGGTAEAINVGQVIEQDAGMWKLRLR
jgi:hypothetical protein